MSRYFERFPKRAFFPVIHVLDSEQTIRNCVTAFECGADGVFLIDMYSQEADRLARIYAKTRKEFTREWIGLNFLGLGLEQLSQLDLSDVSGLWTDNACISKDKESLNQNAWDFKEAMRDWKGLYFGGTAFKYSCYNDDPIVCAYLAKTAAQVMDVVTTSGPGTGKAPPVPKIAAMKRALPDAPLANASGIDGSNIHNYLEYIDAFLVATGINIGKTDNLDPALTRQMADIIHGAART